MKFADFLNTITDKVTELGRLRSHHLHHGRKQGAPYMYTANFEHGLVFAFPQTQRVYVVSNDDDRLAEQVVNHFYAAWTMSDLTAGLTPREARAIRQQRTEMLDSGVRASEVELDIAFDSDGVMLVVEYPHAGSKRGSRTIAVDVTLGLSNHERLILFGN
jgi:hypothetical protein